MNPKNKILTRVKNQKTKLKPIREIPQEYSTSAETVIRKLPYLKLSVKFKIAFEVYNWNRELLLNNLWTESFKYSVIYIWHLVLTKAIDFSTILNSH